MISKITQIAISFFLLLVFNYPLKVQAETVLEEIKRTGLIKIAIREDAAPLGYRDLDSNLTGLCVDFTKVLRKRISQEINREILAINVFNSTLDSRFDLVENKIVHLECGPNTIRQDLNRNIEFSRLFLLTGPQLLIRAEDKTRINLGGSFEGITIGVLKDTATKDFITNKFPLANIEEFLGAVGRRRGIQAVKQGRIDAFASDGILLIGQAILEGLALNKDYQLVPDSPLNCDAYGLILPSNDPQWRDLVNSVIENLQAEQILNKWFNVIFPYLQQTTQVCLEQEVKNSE